MIHGVVLAWLFATGALLVLLLVVTGVRAALSLRRTPRLSVTVEPARSRSQEHSASAA